MVLPGAIAPAFVPGGRRFTLITPLSHGQPTTIIVPMLAPGASSGKLANFIQKHPLPLSHVMPDSNIAIHAGSCSQVPINASPAPTLKRSPSDQALKPTTPQDSEIFTSTNMDSSDRSSVGRSDHVLRHRERRVAPLPETSKKRCSEPNPHNTKPRVRPNKRKVRKANYDVHWIAASNNDTIDVPPNQSTDIAIPAGTIYVNRITGSSRRQLWERDGGIWKATHVGSERLIDGVVYMLHLTPSGRPSWVTVDTYNRT